MKKTVLIATLFVALTHQAYAIFGIVKIAPEIGMNVSKARTDISGLSSLLELAGSQGLGGSGSQGLGSLLGSGSNIPLTLDTKSLTSLRAGLVVDVHVYKPVYLQVGAFYSMEGSNLAAKILFFTLDGKFKASYINVPVCLMYKHDLVVGKAFVGVGPYFGYALKSNINFAVPGSDNIDYDFTFGDGPSDMKRLNIGLGVNAGFELKNGPFIRFQYQLGTTELTNIPSTASIKLSTFSTSIGWLF